MVQSPGLANLDRQIREVNWRDVTSAIQHWREWNKAAQVILPGIVVSTPFLSYLALKNV